jgi:hypothetical protein
MPTLLTDLQLDEVSLVDTPANQEAHVMLFKRDTQEETLKMTDEMKEKLKPFMDKGMSEEEAMKAWQEMTMSKMEEDLEKSNKENERLRKALIDAGFVIKADTIEKKAEPKVEEFIEVEGEKIAKSEIPAPILKRLEQAEIEKAEAAVAKKAEDFPNLKKDVAVKLIKADLLEDAETLEFLRAVDALMGKAMGEEGETHVDADMGSASEKLNKMAEDYAAANKMTFYKAYEAVVKTEDGKALLKAIQKKED